MVMLEWLGSAWLVVLAATFGLVPGITVRALTSRSEMSQVQPYLLIAALAVEYWLVEALRFGFGAFGGVLLAALMAGTFWGWWRTRIGEDGSLPALEQEPSSDPDVLDAFCFALGRVKA